MTDALAAALEKARRECEELINLLAANSRESESSDALECARDAIAAIDRLVAAAREEGAQLQRYGGVSKVCDKHTIEAISGRPMDRFCAFCEIAAARLAGRLEQAEADVAAFKHINPRGRIVEVLNRLRKEAEE